MHRPKGDSRRRSSERPDYLGIFAAAVLGATVTGNEKLQALQRKTQATALFAYGGTDDAIASISAQSTNHFIERLKTSSTDLRIRDCPERTYKVHPNAFCRMKYIMNVTGIFMHGLYNKFEYPDFGIDPNFSSMGFKCVEKYRSIDGEKPETSLSGMRKEVDKNKSINQPVDRTYVDNSDNFQGLTLYRPGQADEVKSVWKEFGIDLSAEQLKQWEYEFYLAGHYCMTKDTEELFLPLQFATAILQICQNLRKSWRSWSELYNKKFPDDNVVISYVMDDLEECFKKFAELYLNFYTNRSYQDCDGYGPLSVAPESGGPARSTPCGIACCHCVDCGDTNQNWRTEIFDNLVKEGMLKRKGHPDDATLADCKKQVSLSLSCWLQRCIYSDYFEFMQSEISNEPFFWNVLSDSGGRVLRWSKSFKTFDHIQRMHRIRSFDVLLPIWYWVKYGLDHPELPTNNGNVPPVERPDSFTMEMLLGGMGPHRKKDQDKELDWIRNVIKVPISVDDFIS